MAAVAPGPCRMKQQRGQGLTVRRGGHLPLDRQVAEKGGHLIASHLQRVPQFMEADEGLAPVHISLLGAKAVVQHTHLAAHLIQQARCGSFCADGGWLGRSQDTKACR